MSRLNEVFLYARVNADPIMSVDKETGEYNYGMVYVDTIRGLRDVDDKVRFAKHDYPLIISREKTVLDQMSEWKENDIVSVKGVLSTKRIIKPSYCSHCTDSTGNGTENQTEGNLVYVTPIHVRKEASYETKPEAIEDVLANREISNLAYILGTVLKDPKIITTKQGVQISQYPIAINRKYVIRTDDPSIKTDWPIVKSYGEQARNDRIYLKYQADVVIDGFIQSRRVRRKQKCAKCGKIYEWEDRSMELVPYDVEYVNGFYTKEEAEIIYQHPVDEYKQMLYESGMNDELEDDLKSEDIYESSNNETEE